MGEDRVGKKGRAELGDGVAASVVACKGAIEPFAKRSGGLARANGKSYADGIVLPPQCGGGGEWDNGSINVRAKLLVHRAKVALIWSNFRDISAWTTENGAVERYDDIAGADSIGGTAVRQYSPPMVAEVGGAYVS